VADGSYIEWSERGRVQLRGTFREGQPVGAWTMSYPEDTVRTVVCKADEYCDVAGELWSDLTQLCQGDE